MWTRTIETAMAINDAPVVVDFVVGKDAMVWPMVAAGTSNDEIMFARDVRPTFDDDDSDRRLSDRTDEMTKHTLSVLVENKPGVLARVAGLFSRRGFNIDSLAVGETEHPDDLPDHDRGQRRRLPARAGDQAAQQAGQRPQDRRAGDRRRRSSASCCWSRYGPTGRPRTQVLETVELFRARVVDVAPDALTIEATGTG